MNQFRSRLRSAVAALVLSASPALLVSSAAAQSHAHPTVRVIEIVVDGGYKPNRVEIHVGERVRLKLVRKEYNACTREILFPALGIRRELPPNQAVYIDLPTLAAGEYEYRCGMNMIRGTLLVAAHS